MQLFMGTTKGLGPCGEVSCSMVRERAEARFLSFGSNILLRACLIMRWTREVFSWVGWLCCCEFCEGR